LAFIALADLFMKRQSTALSPGKLAAFISAQVSAQAALDRALGRGSGFNAMPVRTFAFVVSNRYGTALTRRDAVGLVVTAFACQLGTLFAQLASVRARNVLVRALGYCVATAALVSGAVLQLLSSRSKYRIDHWLLRWLFLYLESVLTSTFRIFKRPIVPSQMLEFYVVTTLFSLNKSTQNMVGQKVLDVLLTTPLARTSPVVQSGTLITAELALLPKLLEKTGIDESLGGLLKGLSGGVTEQLEEIQAAIKSRSSRTPENRAAPLDPRRKLKRD
jgi:hypothetical protein